ncbi:HmuY family protein [Niabella sp. CJ426]|uniref:HmuY family protein n=1 Tax=Niabella sp. CJ426 TaxID=3393740 RepID=UPI003D02FDCF
MLKGVIRITAVIVIATLVSCGKVYDLNGFDWEPDLPLSDTVFNREIQILDLGVNNIPATHKPMDNEDPLYFSLEKINSVHIGYKATERWDIAFFGGSRVNITANNGSRQGIGYGSSGIGGLLVLDSAYSTVTTVPDDSRFLTPGNTGLAGFGEEISPGGYAFYTFFDNIFRRDKIANIDSPDPAVAADANLYMHMIYCISEDFSKTFTGEYGTVKYKPTPKTIIIRTASGNYAKLEMQSLYKGTMNPMEMRRGTDKPLPYASFRYMVIKKDEKRFGFVARKNKLTINLTTKQRLVGN